MFGRMGKIFFQFYPKVTWENPTFFRTLLNCPHIENNCPRSTQNIFTKKCPIDFIQNLSISFQTHFELRSYDIPILFYWIKRGHLHVFSTIQLEISDFQSFETPFWAKLLLQKHPKMFLEVWRSYSRYLEGPPTSGVYNAQILMVMRRPNPFLMKQT